MLLVRVATPYTKMRMMTGDEWSVVFYVDDAGDSPVETFLSSLDLKTQARFLWSIEQLRVRNVQAREPLVRHLDGKLWELREEKQDQHLSPALFLLPWAQDRFRPWFPEEDSEDAAGRDRHCDASDGAVCATGRW